MPGSSSATTQDQDSQNPSPVKPSLETAAYDAGVPVSPGIGNRECEPSPGKHSPSQAPTIPRRPLPPLPPGKEEQQLSPQTLGIRQESSAHSTQSPGRASFPAPPITDTVSPGRASWDGGRPRYNNLPAPPPITGDVSPGRVSWDGGRRPSSRTDLSPGHNNNAESYLTPPGEPGREGLFGYKPSPNKQQRETQSRPYTPRPFHITLIRRDPTHGNQWNVGTITNGSSTAPSEVAADGAITVEITTPGYKRFGGDNSLPVSLESLGLASTSSPSRYSMPAAAPSQPLDHVPSSSETADPSSTNPPEPLKFVRKVAIPHHRRHHSSRDIANPSHAHPPKSMRANYTFTSPWNGTCTFTTGPNGRSLKCKHVIPGAAPTTTAPATSAASTEHDAASDAPPAVTVGEIRFNLPSTTTMGRVPPPATAAAAATTTSSLFHRHRHSHRHQDRGHSQTSTSSTSPTRPQPSSPSQHPHPDPDGHPLPDPLLESEPERDRGDGRLDLRLARERAGGGLRGTSAKLGKLVIEDEGMKMLDLLVAACMGVWWGVYEQG